MVNPLLKQLDLQRTNGALVDFKPYWAKMEEYGLPERIRKVVAIVNETAGFDVLEMLDFTPPQETVLRITFSKHRTEYVMEIVFRERGPAVAFYSRNAQERYFSTTRHSTTFLELSFLAAEIIEKDIEKWLSYLLSGFGKKFKSDSQAPLSESSASQLRSLALDSIGPG